MNRKRQGMPKMLLAYCCSIATVVISDPASRPCGKKEAFLDCIKVSPLL